MHLYSESRPGVPTLPVSASDDGASGVGVASRVASTSVQKKRKATAEAVAVFDEIADWVNENGVPSDLQGKLGLALKGKMRRLSIELGAVRMEHSSYRGLWGAILKELYPTKWSSRQHVADHVGASNKVLRTWREKVITIRQRRGEGVNGAGRLSGPSPDERPEQATSMVQPWLHAPGQQPDLCSGAPVSTKPNRLNCNEDNVDAACSLRRSPDSTATVMPSLLQLSLPPAAMRMPLVSSSTTGAAARSKVTASAAGAVSLWSAAAASAGASRLRATVAAAAGAADVGEALTVSARAAWLAPPVAWVALPLAWAAPALAWAAPPLAWAAPPAAWAAQPAVWVAQPAAWAAPPGRPSLSPG